MTQRDAKGRFVSGNAFSSIGGKARMARLSQAERRAFARQGLAGLANRHFNGNLTAAKAYLADCGRYAYDKALFSKPELPMNLSE